MKIQVLQALQVLQIFNPSGGLLSSNQVFSFFQAALECAIDYSQKRFAFNQPISSFQAMQVFIYWLKVFSWL